MKELDTLKSTPAVGIAIRPESPNVSDFFIREPPRGPARTGDAETDHEPKFQRMVFFNRDRSWTPVAEKDE
jgi:hypothetical protein